MSTLQIDQKVRLLDDLDGHCGKIAIIINIKTGPFGQGLLYDLKFEDGYVLPDLLRSEITTDLEKRVFPYNIAQVTISQSVVDELNTRYICNNKVYSKQGCSCCWHCPKCGKSGCSNLAGFDLNAIRYVECE